MSQCILAEMENEDQLGCQELDVRRRPRRRRDSEARKVGREGRREGRPGKLNGGEGSAHPHPRCFLGSSEGFSPVS